MAQVSRDARNILNALRDLGSGAPTIDDIFEAEQLAFSFYGKTVVGHIKRMFNPNSKGDPARVAFYVKPTRSLNKGRRNKEDWAMTDDERRVYWLISKQYLIEDFNYDALIQLRTICNSKYEDVNEAMGIAIDEDVRSIPYLFRVLEGLGARREFKRKQIEDRRRLFMGQAQEQKHVRGKAEIASLMYSWQETIQNVELQRKVKDLHRED